MELDTDYIDTITDKDELISYASDMGVTGLVKQRSLAKLKKDLVTSFKKGGVSISALKAAATEADSLAASVIDGSETYSVYLSGQLHTQFELDYLGEWCANNNISQKALLSTLNRPHVHHSGYTLMKD